MADKRRWQSSAKLTLIACIAVPILLFAFFWFAVLS